MVQVTRKKKETTLSLMKRFGRKMQKSGTVSRFKKTQFKNRKVSDLNKKRKAITRIRYSKKLNEMYKMGKLSK